MSSRKHYPMLQRDPDGKLPSTNRMLVTNDSTSPQHSQWSVKPRICVVCLLLARALLTEAGDANYECSQGTAI